MSLVFSAQDNCIWFFTVIQKFKIKKIRETALSPRFVHSVSFTKRINSCPRAIARLEESSRGSLRAPLSSSAKLCPQNNFVKVAKTCYHSWRDAARSRKENSWSHEQLPDEHVLLGMLAVSLRHSQKLSCPYSTTTHIYFILTHRSTGKIKKSINYIIRSRRFMCRARL